MRRFKDILAVLEPGDNTSAPLARARLLAEGNGRADAVQIDTPATGTLRRADLAGMCIGNTADAVSTHLGASALAAKPEGFISPVTLAEDSTP